MMKLKRSSVLLTIATHPRMIAAVAMVLAASLLLLVGPLTNKAQAQMEPPPKLSGEELVAANLSGSGDLRGGDLTVTGTCGAPTSTSTFDFAASGEARGPYPGTFTETGTVEMGPPTFSGLSIENLTTNFEIDSKEVGHVTGTKRFVPDSSTGSGGCGPDPVGTTVQVGTGNLQVEATIETPDGRTCTTTGTADLNFVTTFLPGIGVNKYFQETFDAAFDTPTCEGSEEPRPQISIANATVNEGDTGTSEANFDVTLSKASTNAVTVDYTTADGTAKQPEDYQQTQGTLTFEANQTTATVTVPVRGDIVDEPDEGFSVLLSNAHNAEIADREGFATIIDDDEAADTTPPVLSLPNDMTMEATGPNGVEVTYNASANDAVDGGVNVNCTPGPGSTFSLGDTTVSCTATDHAGNSSESTFKVKVVDTTSPTLEAHADVSATATSSSGAVVDYANPTASDLVDGNNVAVNCTPSSGGTFPLGQTTVTCSATDKAGNKAEESFKVSVTYAWSGALQPINGGSTPEYSDDTSLFKLGSTVPVKFTLTDASAGISGAETKLYAAKVTNEVVGTEVEATSTATSSSGNLFRYDATSGQYIYNWSTKGLTAGTYQLRIDLADGASKTVRVSLR